MTFRCEQCARTSLHGEKAHRVVTATRQHEHPFRKDAQRDGSHDKGGTGSQIVSEKTVCGQCIA